MNDVDPLNEELENESPQEAREWFRQEIATRGIRISYGALISVCQDPKAPAPAKATAGVALLRAAGVFAREDDTAELEPHQMTAAQLEREVRRLNGRRRSLSRRPKSGDGGVFD